MSMSFWSAGKGDGWGRILVVPVIGSALFFLLAVAGILYFVNMAADQANQRAADNSRHLMKTALSEIAIDINGRLLDYAWWDETVLQYRNGFDPDWAEDNIGAYLHEDFAYSGTYVLNPDHQTVYFYSAGPGVERNVTEAFGPGIRNFLAKVQSLGMEKSYPMNAYFARKGQIHLLAAASITPEEPSAEQLERHARPVLLFHRILDAELLAQISGRYLLPEAKLAAGKVAGGVVLRDADGAVVATAIWRQPTPGDHLLDNLLPKILAVALALLMFSVFVFIMWSRSARAAIKAKGQFLAKMSHELRTPLNPIIGFSEMMSKEMLGSMPLVYRQYAKDIATSGRHMQGLVDGLLELSKIDAGAITLSESRVDIPRLLGEVSEITQISPVEDDKSSTQVSFSRDIDNNLPDVMADPLRIRQVLINLLTNAARHSSGNEIKLRAYLVQGAICIEIVDDGKGISKNDLARVFEPMVQLTGAGGKASTDGFGLGLTISRELMKLHGGTLELQSEPGVGTTAILTFPRNRTCQPETPSAA